MSRTTTTNADFWSAATAAFTTLPAAGATLFGWYKSTAIGADGQFLSVDSGTIDSNDWALMVGSGGVNGQVGIYAWSSGGSVAFGNAAGTLPNSVWRFVAGVLNTGASRAAYNNTTKGTSTTSATAPAGVNGMHINGINNRGIAGQHAHRGVGLRSYSDIELAYLAGGGQPSNLGVEHYWQMDSGGATESDVGSSASLIAFTLHGTTAGVDDPDFASYWTAAGLGAVSWTQGSAISNIDFTTKFRNAHSAYTTTLKVLSAGSQVTTTVGAGTASNLMTVNSVAGIAVGSYISDGPLGTQALVLSISGNTLLLNTFLSWANSDPIYVYTASTKTFTGPSITANVLSGTPAAGDVGTYTLIPRATCNNNAALIADGPSFTINVSSSGAAASFTAGPTLTSTQTDGHTFGVTSNQTAVCWLGYYVKGSSAPTAAQVIAGTGTGFIQKTSQSLTATVAGSITSTALTKVISDAYLCLTNGSGNSAVVPFTAILIAPAAGKQFVPITVISVSAVTKANPAQVTATAHGRTTGDYVQVYGLGGMVELNALFTAAQTVQCTVIDANTLTLNGIDSTGFTTYTSGGYLSFGASMYAQATTLPVTGDIGVWDVVTAENGLPVTAFANGRYSIAAGTMTSRQSWAVDIFSVSANGLVGVVTDYVANQPPLLVQQTIGSPLPGIFLAANQTIPSTNVVTPFAQDPEGDTLGVSFLATPAGISVSGQNATGTTGGAQILQTTATFTDKPGEQTSMGVAWVIGQVNPPLLLGLTQAPADRLLASTYLSATYASQADPNPAGAAPAGTVIAQNPPFGVPVQPNTVINVTLSNGLSSASAGGTTIINSSTLVKSTQLLLQESQSGQPTPLTEFIAFGSCLAGASDLAATGYRFFRIPSSAQITSIELQNSPIPGGNYCLGLYLPSGGAAIANAILCPQGLTLDTGRNVWTDVYMPSVVGGSPSPVNVGKRLWELLGLPADPSGIQDVVYDLVLTAVTPGTAAGIISMQAKYIRGPDRGMISAAPVK